MATLTTANSSLALQVRGLFPTPQVIKGYATDDSFAVEDVSAVETYMGVDGLMSAGYVPQPTVLTIMLQADSPSTAMFDAVISAQQAGREAFIFDGVIILQGTSEKYVFTKGWMTNHTPMSTAKKTLQARKFTITFESSTKAPS